MNPPLKIAIVGGGLSGSLTAINLLCQGQPVAVTLFEQVPSQLNRGAAYTENNRYQPLNVPIGKMSLFSDQPDHFYNWLREDETRMAACVYGVEREHFVPRKVFGDYLTDMFRATVAETNHQVETVTAQVTSIEPQGDGYMLQAADNQLYFDRVVIASGTIPPQKAIFLPPHCRSLELPVIHSWQGLPKLESNKQVLIVGSGLSMVDVIIELDRQGFAGHTRVLSLRGLIPQPEIPEAAVDLNLKPIKSLNELFGHFKKAAQTAGNQGSGWRSVINNLRPYTHQLWQGLEEVDKQRFMRHLQPYWEVHRHRVPQFSHQLVQGLIDSGKLDLLKGRITDISKTENGRAVITYRPRHIKATVSFEADLIVNCTGPVADLGRSGDPLLEQLLKSGLATAGPLNIGLNTNEVGEFVSKDGQVRQGLFAIGSLRKGTLWETTALREIREQAEALPKALLAGIGLNI